MGSGRPLALVFRLKKLDTIQVVTGVAGTSWHSPRYVLSRVLHLIRRSVAFIIVYFIKYYSRE